MHGVHLQLPKPDGTHLLEEQRALLLIHGLNPRLEELLLLAKQRTTRLLQKMKLARRGGPKRKRTKAK